MKKGMTVIMMFLCAAALFAQKENSAPLPETESETAEEIVAPIEIEIPVTEPPLVEPFEAPQPLSTEALKAEWEEVNRLFITYQALQYSSVVLTGLGVLFVILDAFIPTGSEYSFTPPTTANNPHPETVKTAFGNLSVAGAVVAFTGAAASIGFQFPYKKYRNRRYVIENQLAAAEKLEAAEKDAASLIREVEVE